MSDYFTEILTSPGLLEVVESAFHICLCEAPGIRVTYMLILPELSYPTILNGSFESNMNLLWMVVPEDGNVIASVYPTPI